MVFSTDEINPIVSFAFFCLINKNIKIIILIARTPIITLRILIILFFDFISGVGEGIDFGLGSGHLFSSEQASKTHLLLL